MGRLYDFVGDGAALDEHARGVAHGLGELLGPQVFPDDEGCGRAGLQAVCRGHQVLVIQEAVDDDARGTEHGLHVRGELRELGGVGRAIEVLGHERQVDDSHHALLVQGAHVILGRHGADSDLRRFGRKLAASINHEIRNPLAAVTL